MVARILHGVRRHTRRMDRDMAAGAKAETFGSAVAKQRQYIARHVSAGTKRPLSFCHPEEDASPTKDLCTCFHPQPSAQGANSSP